MTDECEIDEHLGYRDNRTPEERELDQLRDYLACNGEPLKWRGGVDSNANRPRAGRASAWSGGRDPDSSLPWAENVCILAGLDPERSLDGDDPVGWDFLPGARAFYGFNEWPDRDDRGGWYALENGVQRQVGMLVGLHLPTSPPKAAIKATLDANIPIPWLEIAQNDDICRQYLPDPTPTLDATSPLPEAKVLPIPIDQARSKGGKAAAETKYPTAKEQKMFVYAKFKEGMAGEDIIKALVEKYDPAHEEGARKWLTKFRRDETGEAMG